MPAKTPKKTAPSKSTGPTESGTPPLAEELRDVAHELRSLYHLEALSDNVGDLAVALRRLADATAMSAIAAYGTEEDRATAVSSLKNYLEDFPR